jgi:hypothetical protein
MRRGRIVIGVALLLSALTLGGASAAFAASPQDICKDLADGRVDGTYTNAEWNAYFSDPTIQGYGCGGIAPAGGASPTLAARPTQIAVKTPRGAGGPLGTVTNRGTLPFTGAQLALFTLVGLALVGSGLLLRSTGKHSHRR